MRENVVLRLRVCEPIHMWLLCVNHSGASDVDYDSATETCQPFTALGHVRTPWSCAVPGMADWGLLLPMGGQKQPAALITIDMRTCGAFWGFHI